MWVSAARGSIVAKSATPAVAGPVTARPDALSHACSGSAGITEPTATESSATAFHPAEAEADLSAVPRYVLVARRMRGRAVLLQKVSVVL